MAVAAVEQPVGDYMIFLHLHLLVLPVGAAVAGRVLWTAAERNFPAGILFGLA